MMHPDEEELREVGEGPFDRGSLLGIAFAPTIWALHFLTLYVIGAVACAKDATRIAEVLPLMGGATVAALAGVALVSWPSWREWRRETGLETDRADRRSRSHFLAHASLLLAGLSSFAIFAQSLPAVLSLSCR